MYTGITADEFVKPTKTTPPTSRYTQFRQAVSKMLGYPSLESIEIVSLTEGEGYLDVWFSAHASPYVNPSQGESAVMLNQDEVKFAFDVCWVIILLESVWGYRCDYMKIYEKLQKVLLI